MADRIVRGAALASNIGCPAAESTFRSAQKKEVGGTGRIAAYAPVPVKAR
jgi:hypothetical protein